MNENEKLREIIRLSAQLNTVQDVDILLERILHDARSFMNADAGTIYVRSGSNLVFSHAQNDTLQKKIPVGSKLIYSTFRIPINTSSIAGFVAARGEILNLTDAYNLPEGVPYRFDPSYDNLANYKTVSVLTVPLKTEMGKIIGVLQMINAKNEQGEIVAFDEEDEMYVYHFAISASMVLQRAQMTRALLLRMIQMAQLRDPKETGPHVNRVASYSVEIYERWAHYRGLADNEIETSRDILRMAAVLHDVGKVGISDLILKKPGKLDEHEYNIMKSHTYIGAALFKDSQSDFDEAAAMVALTHHENWDGTGYPGHIDVTTGEIIERDTRGNAMPRKGDEIPIYGRIVALADVFDALSSRRVYKESWEENKVLAEIKSLSGIKFDPELVEIFFDSMDLIRSIIARYPDQS